MMDDFRKYATKHLGMNSMVLDDVIKSQAGYLNPYILEERQLNVTQLDVFSRLMMDRIIFWVLRLMTIQPIHCKHSCYTWILWIRGRIFPFTSTRRVALCMPVWASMIPCSLSAVMWRQSVPVWLLPWQPCCWWQVKKVNVQP